MASPRKQPLLIRARKPRQTADPVPDFNAKFKQELHQLIGQNVRTWRERRGLTLAQLSQRSGVSLYIISRMEQGAGRLSISTLERIGAGLGILGSALLKGDERIYDRMMKRQKPATAARRKPRAF